MKMLSRTRVPVWMSVIATLALATGMVSVQAAPSADDLAARVIVKYKTSSTLMHALSAADAATQARGPQHAQALSQRTGLSLADGRAINARTQVLKASGISSVALAARLASESDVEYAVVDQRRHVLSTPNDPRYAGGQTSITPAVGQWYLRASGSSAVAAIDAEGAWAIATGHGIVVADLDTGVRFDHPDLAVKLYPGYDFIHDAAVANDGDIEDNDASDPGDWITSAENSQAGGEFENCGVEDSSWHGTQTAGLIGAATNNGVGMAGAGADVMVLPLRVLGKCGGYDSDIIAAMNWAVGVNVPGVPTNTHVAKVINMSLGSADTCSPAYADAVTAATQSGAVIVVSAGNDGLAVNTPANCAGVIAVAGVRHSGTKVGYSSLGPEVSIAAPAGNCVNATGTCLYPILTTTNAGTTTPAANTYSDGTNTSLGTSFSAPLVSATAALMFSAQPSLTPAQLIAKLKGSARAFPGTGAGSGVSACHAPGSAAQDAECYCTASTCGAGLLDAGAAVAAAAGVPAPTTATTSGGSSSGGGGALGLPWLFGLALAVLALQAGRSRRARAESKLSVRPDSTPRWMPLRGRALEATRPK